MVYIARDGRVLQNQPWSIQRVVQMFMGFFGVVWLFLKSLFDPVSKALESSKSSRGNGGGGGGGGGGSGRRGPPGPPNRRIGRITTISDCTIPGGG